MDMLRFMYSIATLRAIEQSRSTYTNIEGETFMEICDKMGIHKHHRRIYYDLLGPMYGPKGGKIDGSSKIGAKMKHP